MSPLLTPAEVGEVLGRSARWVRERARAGEIEHTLIGSSVRFSPEQVNGYIAANTRQGHAKSRTAHWGYTGRRTA